jgi:hypothetical protein
MPPEKQGWDAKEPLRHWTSSGSIYKNRAPPRSNRWLLHPWLPIDVRLPALVGVCGMATYLYLEQTGKLQEAQDAIDRQVDSAKQSVGGAAAWWRDTVAWAKASAGVGREAGPPHAKTAPAVELASDAATGSTHTDPYDSLDCYL